MLPKFLLADNSQVSEELIFIVHTESPRFIVECDLDGFDSNQKIHWQDDKPESEKLMEELMELAEDFLETELENQEDLYDDEEE